MSQTGLPKCRASLSWVGVAVTSAVIETELIQLNNRACVFFIVAISLEPMIVFQYGWMKWSVLVPRHLL